MRRQRLRHNTGCLRCRKRHKKCDEHKPVCDFCARWHLLCIWPSTTSNSAPAPGRRSPKHDVQIQVPSLKRLRPHDLYGVPVQGADKFSRPMASLHRFFTNMIGDALPFKSGRAYLDLGQGWLKPVLSDELVTTSFMAYCSRYEALRQKDAVLKRSSVQCENRALTLLQQRLTSETPIGANTILAACIHFTTAAFEHSQSVDLQKLALGVRSLVDTRGGFWKFAEQVGPSILQSVLICDFLISYLYGGAPLYPDMPRPTCPPSLEQLHDAVILDSSVSRNCSAEVGVVLQDLRVLMLCRRPSEVDYGSTTATAWYPVLLLQYIDTRLAALQSRHYGTATITEVMVHCMMLARLVMLLSVRQHVQMVSNVLQRLSQALEFSRLFEQISETPRLAFWVCTLVLMSEITPVTTIDFDGTFILTLEAVLGGERSTWPEDWREQINEVLHNFLWLASVDAEFDRVCNRILDPPEIANEEDPGRESAPRQVQPVS